MFLADKKPVCFEGRITMCAAVREARCLERGGGVCTVSTSNASDAAVA